MSNTLTGLIPTIYESIDVVSREMVGFIPAVTMDASAERAALNQSILVPVTQSQTASDNTPGVTPPNTGDQTIGNISMTISKSKNVAIRWNGEDTLGMKTAGTYERVRGQQFQQAFRTLVNLIEVDLANTAYQNASRAYGAAGTAPFGTSGDLSDSAQLAKILDDNGAPVTDRQLVLNSSSVANLRGKQSLLLRANEEGSNDFRRSGMISQIPLDGFALHNSAGLVKTTAGTGTSYVTSGSTAPGVSSIALVTGSGTVVAGDVVTFAADTNNKYVVQTGVAAPGTIVLGGNGALVTIATANAMTIGGAYTPNVGFARSAINLITRAPARPEGGDMANDVIIVQDPVSGLAFEIAEYKEYRQNAFLVSIAWGTAAVASRHIATLMG